MTQEPKKRPSNTPHPEANDNNKFLIFSYHNGLFYNAVFDTGFLCVPPNTTFSTTIYMCKDCHENMDYCGAKKHSCEECVICGYPIKKKICCPQCEGIVCEGCAMQLQKCPFCRKELSLMPAPLQVSAGEEKVPMWVEEEFRRLTEEVGF